MNFYEDNKMEDTMDGEVLTEIRYVRDRIDQLYNVVSNQKSEITNVSVKLREHIDFHWKFFTILSLAATAIAIGVSMWRS